MATIRQIVSAAVASITDPPAFLWGAPHDLNDRLDNVSENRVVLMLPKEALQTPGKRMQMNKIPMTHIVSVAVAKRSNLDDDYEDTRAETLDEMETLALEIFVRVRVAVYQQQGMEIGEFYLTELDKFGMEGISGYFNAFDANFDGLQLTFELMTNDASPVCYEGVGKVTVDVE